MDDPRTKRTLELAEREAEAAQGVGERAGRAAGAGDDRHAGRLVDDEQVLVGGEDGERDALGEELGAGALAEDDEALPGAEAWGALEDGPPVDAHAPGGDEKTELATRHADERVEPRAVHLDAE